MNTQITTAEPSIYDGQTFERMMQIAEVLANCELVPDCLRGDKNGKFPIEKARANCFLVTEQASRWGMSPFAVAQHASVVRGRLMWEGKLVAAVITAKMGITLDYTYHGDGEKMSVIVSGILPGEVTPRTVGGTVTAWKTDQWTVPNYAQRLAYRGSREWCRRHAPAVMLGVYTDDEEAPPIRAAVGRVAEPLPSMPSMPKIAPTEQPTEQPTDAPLDWISAKFLDVTHTEGETKGKPWQKWSAIFERENDPTITAVTFSHTIGEYLDDLKFNEVSDVEIIVEIIVGKGIKLVAIRKEGA